MNYGCYFVMVGSSWSRNRKKQLVAWLKDGDYSVEIRKTIPRNITASKDLQEELLQKLKKLWISRQAD